MARDDIAERCAQRGDVEFSPQPDTEPDRVERAARIHLVHEPEATLSGTEWVDARPVQRGLHVLAVAAHLLSPFPPGELAELSDSKPASASSSASLANAASHC